MEKMNLGNINWLWTAMVTDDKTVLHILNSSYHINRGSNERYIISEAIATIQCKGYGTFMLGHLPICKLQILFRNNLHAY